MAGGTAAVHGGYYLTALPEAGAAVWLLAAISSVSGAALVVGFMTPAAAGTVSVVTLLLASSPGESSIAIPIVDRWPTLLVIVDAAALALLGPGAHSIDAFLFGRSEIILPHDDATR